MGTRSTIKIYGTFDRPEKREKNGEKVLPVASIYQQFDGYHSGVGLDLAEFLDGITVINGISGENVGTHANGMGCLAAQFIQQNKTNIGGFYMTHPEDEQEYNYEVWFTDDGLIMIEDEFEGTPEEFIKMVNEKDE